jgi:hypothetical protein
MTDSRVSGNVCYRISSFLFLDKKVIHRRNDVFCCALEGWSVTVEREEWLRVMRRVFGPRGRE